MAIEEIVASKGENSVINHRAHFGFLSDAETGREVALYYPICPTSDQWSVDHKVVVAERLNETKWYDTTPLPARATTLPLEDDEFDALYVLFRNIEAVEPLLSEVHLALSVLHESVFIIEQVPNPYWWGSDALSADERLFAILRHFGNGDTRVKDDISVTAFASVMPIRQSCTLSRTIKPSTIS